MSKLILPKRYGGYRRYEKKKSVVKVVKPSAKHLRELAVLREGEIYKSELEGKVKKYKKPIDEYNKVKWQQDEAIRLAIQRKEPDALAAAKKVKTTITWDEMHKASKPYGKAKQELHVLTLELEKQKLKVDLSKPIQPGAVREPTTVGDVILGSLVLGFLVSLFWVVFIG